MTSNTIAVCVRIHTWRKMVAMLINDRASGAGGAPGYNSEKIAAVEIFSGWRSDGSSVIVFCENLTS